MLPCRPHAGLALLVCAASARLAAGAGPDFDFVRGQIDAGAVAKTTLAGRTDVGTEYKSDRVDGGVVVGADVAVARFGDFDAVVAVRPLFLTPSGTVVGHAIGEFDRWNHTDQTVRDRGLREQTVLARKGYAVAEVHVLGGTALEHLSFVFARMTPNGLDLTDTYRSEAIGRGVDGRIQVVRTDGRYAVGLTARAQRGIVSAVGLTHVKQGAPAAKSTAGPAHPPAEPPATGGPTGPKLGGKQVKPRAEEPEEADPAPQEGSSGGMTSRLPSWAIPAGIGVGVTVGALLLGLVLFRGKKKAAPPPRRAPRRATRR